MNERTMWSDTKTPWEDLAKEDTERINAWLHGVACNWSFLEKTVGFTEFGHLGGMYWQDGGNNKDIVWVTEKDLIKTTAFKKPFIPAFAPTENTITPVAKVERYKNWIRQLCNRGGYCYLILFKRKYRPYAFLLYGKNPQLGDLNLDAEYRSEVFGELNVAVNYPKKLIHVYSATSVVYADGFEKYKDNEGLIDNWWLPHYTVGTMEIHRTDIQPEGSTRPGEIHHTSSYVHPSDEEEESASQAKYIKREKKKKAERAYINSLMTGGMTSIQGHMTSQQEQEIKKERDHYKKKAEKLEKKYRKKPASRASTPGTPGGSDDGGFSRSNLFDSGDPSEPDTADNEVLDRYKHKLEGAKGPKMKIPDTFTGDRTDVTRFIRQCRVYFITKRKEFSSEMDKMLWITSLCDGEAVEGWVDWITLMLNEKNKKAPKKASEMLAFLSAYFGDPDEVSTARHKLDQIKQTRRIEEYVVAFQSIAYKTKYTEAELEHRFIVGLKQEI